MSTILVAGIGNIFLGDDAFGVEVVQQMLREPAIGDDVAIIDFGIRGMDLAYSLLDERYAAAIFVDAVPRGGAPGTLYVIEPGESDFVAPPGDTSLVDAHTMNPLNVLRLSRSMCGTLGRVLIIGCEPAPFDPEIEMEIQMSPPVRAAIPRAIELVHEYVGILHSEMVRASATLPRGAYDGSSIAAVE